MSKQDALDQGSGYTKVGAKEIQEDRQLNNRLADVNLKMAQYQRAMQLPLSSNGWFSQSDATLIAQVLGDDKFKAGAFGTSLPVDWMNKLGQRSLKGKLSSNAVQRLVAYYNAREAINGYQRVLTGSGRSSEAAMQLNLDAIPTPIDHDNYAMPAIQAFRQNIGVAAQGMPILPGVKTPEEIEPQVNTR